MRSEILKKVLAALTDKVVALRTDLTALQREPGPPGKDAEPVDVEALVQIVIAQVPKPVVPTVDTDAIVRAVVARIPLPPEIDDIVAHIPVPRAVAAEPGPMGPMPDHEWSGTKLRFQKPDGSWGEFVDLKGDSGKAGGSGVVFVNNSDETPPVDGGGGEDPGGDDVDPLARWHALGTASRTMALFGDSTSDPTWQNDLFDALNQETAAGGLIEGATVVACSNVGTKVEDFNLSPVVTYNPNLTAFSGGINNVKKGADTATTLQAKVLAKVNAVRAALPNTDLLLRTPNSLAIPTNNFEIDPATEAATQAATDAMWTAFNNLKGTWDHAAYIDSQTDVFGRTVQAVADNTLMKDELHPGTNGQRREAKEILDAVAVRPAPIDLAASAAAWAGAPNAPWTLYARALEDTRYCTLLRRGIVNWANAGENVGIGNLYIDQPVDGETYPNNVQNGDFFWSSAGSLRIEDHFNVSNAGNVLMITAAGSAAVATLTLTGITKQYRRVS